MKTFSTILAPALLLLLFLYAAVSKLISPEDFRHQLYLQPFPRQLADLLFYALPSAELLAVLLLCFQRTQRTGLFFSAGLLAAFTVYISMVLLHVWTKVPCSCGGILSRMSWTTHLVFNWCFVLINLTALLFRPSGRKQDSPV
ncbi:MauE/DoxX family redox-associated membrane protein [Mucilaginibacter sp. SP1R1]|uniref:MauE/DoxX family redox-associated membrane protein n=1 Tax=Mucilaginibacter sp. SP1R1 TaxID=2723091 RepID=UPI00161B5631|nr:MauE/DoxX family redox-associated membrane protein [Mucilaginibacter sp. SP1R1]MBB6152398.1 hypothetical protein [Mucilaginibacter sp. SP1R1]